MKKVIFMFLTIGITTLVSCKSTDASLQRATATTIGQTLSSEVQVSNVKRGASNVTWNAKKNGECFKCESDDMVRRTSCKKVECEN